jgi:tetratricopeptide (TPR) repeat protein
MGEQKSRTDYFVYLICWFLVSPFLFSAGCARKQQAIDLYVDAVMLRELDQNEVAVKRLNSAIEADRHFPLAYSLLGEIYQDMQEYEKSASAYEEATKLNPWSFKDYFNLGRVRQIMKEFAKAVQAYVKACEVGPDPAKPDLHAKAHLYAAQSYYELKDYDAALMYGERAEQIDPNMSDLHKLLGKIYSSRKDYHLAIRTYTRALEIDAGNVELMASLAFAYLNTDQYQPAIELLTEVVEDQPDNHTAYQQLGYCHLQINNADMAIESYNRAIAANNRDWEALNGLGIAYVFKSLGTKNPTLKTKAVEQWRLSLEINPQQYWRPRLLDLIREHSTQ